MSDLEKLFEAIGRRPVTIYRHRDGWHVDLQIRDYPIQSYGDSLATAIRAAQRMVLAHAQDEDRDSEEHARRARDEVARLRAIVGEGK